MKDNTIKTILYILLVLGLILLAGHFEYIAHQEDKESTEICKLQDKDTNNY